jgi:hypothetical protein
VVNHCESNPGLYKFLSSFLLRPGQWIVEAVLVLGCMRAVRLLLAHLNVVAIEKDDL